MFACFLKTNFIRFSFSTALLLGLFITPVQADPNLNCGVYASEAIKEINEANALGCGFSGGRWTTDYNAHLNWCKTPGVTILHIGGEDQARLAQLEHCRENKQAQNAQCDTYAAMMVGYAKENLTLGCGLTGGRFSGNYTGHLNWCMKGQSPANLENEISIAQQAIAQCQGSSIARTRCDIFQAGNLKTWTDRYNEACAGTEEGFNLRIPSSYKQLCVDNQATDAWMNQQVSDLKAGIAACNAKTEEGTFVEPRHFGFLVDACWDNLGLFCDEFTAESYCRFQGFSEMTGYLIESTSKTLHLSCLKEYPRDKPNQTITITRDCRCEGDCGYLAFVGCTGRK